MIRQFFRLFFPYVPPDRKVPLMPREWSGEHSRHGAPPPERARDIQVLRGLGVARTHQDAHRLLMKYPDKHVIDIAHMETRKRKRKTGVHRMARKLRRLMG